MNTYKNLIFFFKEKNNITFDYSEVKKMIYNFILNNNPNNIYLKNLILENNLKLDYSNNIIEKKLIENFNLHIDITICNKNFIPELADTLLIDLFYILENKISYFIGGCEGHILKFTDNFIFETPYIKFKSNYKFKQIVIKDFYLFQEEDVFTIIFKERYIKGADLKKYLEIKKDFLEIILNLDLYLDSY